MFSVVIPVTLRRQKYRPHDCHVADSLVPQPSGEQPEVCGIVAQNRERVLACANPRNREYIQDRVPESLAESDRGGDADPLDKNCCNRFAPPQYGEFSNDLGWKAIGNRSLEFVRMRFQ